MLVLVCAFGFGGAHLALLKLVRDSEVISLLGFFLAYSRVSLNIWLLGMLYLRAL